MRERIELQGELSTLNQRPARRRVSAVELPDGRWLMSSSDQPALIVEADCFEEAYLDLEEAREVLQRRVSINHQQQRSEKRDYGIT